MKIRVALYEEPGGQMIIRRDGSPEAFILLDSPAGDFASDAAELATSEVALEAYRYFEMRGKTSAYGRVLPPAEKR